MFRVYEVTKDGKDIHIEDIHHDKINNKKAKEMYEQYKRDVLRIDDVSFHSSRYVSRNYVGDVEVYSI